MNHLEHLKNKHVGEAVTTGSECHTWRRVTVINQASTMLKSFNINLRQRVLGLFFFFFFKLQVHMHVHNYSQQVQACCSLPTVFSLGVIEWKAKRILGSWAQTVGAELMQTDRPRSRPLMSPPVLTWKRQCSPKAECFATHTFIRVGEENCKRKKKQMEETGDERREQKDRGKKRVTGNVDSAKINR